MLGDIHTNSGSMHSTATGTSPLLGRPPPSSFIYKEQQHQATPPPLYHDHGYTRHYGNSEIHHTHYTTNTPLSNPSLREIPSPVFPDHHRHFHEHSDPSYYARSATGRSNTSFSSWNSSPPLPSAAIRPLGLSDGSKQVGATRSVGGRFVATPAATVGKPPPSSSPCYGSPPPGLLARPKLTITAWEDEGTTCYQVDAKGICVARRAGKLLELIMIKW